MNMHARGGLLDGSQYLTVVKRRQITRQASLNADFGRPQIPGMRGVACLTARNMSR